MQVKEVADIYGIDKKEVIDEVEARRANYEAQGFKLAKKLNAASKLPEELVAILFAQLDQQRQQKAEQEKAAESRRARDEEERRRAADAIKREQEEKERQARQEASRRLMEAELARKMAEMERIQAEQARRDAEGRVAGHAAVAVRAAAVGPEHDLARRDRFTANVIGSRKQRGELSQPFRDGLLRAANILHRQHGRARRAAVAVDLHQPLRLEQVTHRPLLAT